MTNIKQYRITYHNEGRPEKYTASFSSLEEVEKTREFLKFQGATKIRIRQIR